MKWMCLLAFLIIPATSWGHAPYIDHCLMDDPTGALTIYGNFAAQVGVVTVDSVSVPVGDWTSDSIVCYLPDTGHGSCGLVTVSDVNGSSNGRLLSMWMVRFSYTFNSPYGDNGHGTKVFYRLDLGYCLSHSSMLIKMTDTISSYWIGGGPGNGQPNTSDTTIYGSKEIRLDLIKPQLDFGFDAGLYRAVATFDSRFNVQTGSSQTGPHERVTITGFASFIPSDSELSLSVESQSNDRVTMSGFTISTVGQTLYVTRSSNGIENRLVIFDVRGSDVATFVLPAMESHTSFHSMLHPGMYVAELEGKRCRFIVIQ